jgi:hypothetical protein
MSKTSLLGACVLALVATDVAAQRGTTPTATVTDVMISGTDNRVVEMEYLRNNGAAWASPEADMGFGKQIAAAGDANGDGFNDLLVAAYEDGPSATHGPQTGGPAGDNVPAGVVYLLFGSDHSLPSAADIGAPNGSGNFSSSGRTGSISGAGIAEPTQGHVKLVGGAISEETGASMTGADLNGDGRSDLIIGAPGADMGAADNGAVYVVFGRDDWPSQLDLGALDDTDGFILTGESAGDRLGGTLANAGDVNADGLDDIIMGAPTSTTFSANNGGGQILVTGGGATMGGTQDGGAWLVYGQTRFAEGFDIDRMAASEGMVFAGAASGDMAGAAVSGAGDVDGDGFADFLIGAPGASHGGMTAAGEAYLVLGSSSLPDMIDLGNLGAMGVTVQGSQAGEQLGASVAGGSDLDNDGFDDFAAGAPGFDIGGYASGSDEGRVVVLLGAALPGPVVDMANPNMGSASDMPGQGYSGSGPSRGNLGLIGEAEARDNLTVMTVTGGMPGDQAGSSLSMGGNLHGDRFDDLVIGASGHDSTFLVNGGSDLPDSLGNVGSRGLEFGATDGGTAAFTFAGDMNGDGFDDLAMGAPMAGADDAGQVQVVKGCANYALAFGALLSDTNFTMALHGTPHTDWLLMVSDSALEKPTQTWRGDYWLGDKHWEVLSGTFDKDGESVFTVYVPDAGFENLPVYWQAVTLPQGNGQDLTGLMTTEVVFPD